MISKIFQSGGIITKDTPLYMLNTPEKLEKYNKIIEADRFIKNKNSKDFYYQKLLENNSKIKNDNNSTKTT